MLSPLVSLACANSVNIMLKNAKEALHKLG